MNVGSAGNVNYNRHWYPSTYIILSVNSIFSWLWECLFLIVHYTEHYHTIIWDYKTNIWGYKTNTEHYHTIIWDYKTINWGYKTNTEHYHIIILRL